MGDQNSLSNLDYLKAHEKDFPVLHIVDGQNPPIVLVQPMMK
jgi:hypothetical protein